MGRTRSLGITLLALAGVGLFVARFGGLGGETRARGAGGRSGRAPARP